MRLHIDSFSSLFSRHLPLRLRLAILTGAVLLIASGMLLVFLNVMFRQVLVGDVLTVSGREGEGAGIFVQGVTIVPDVMLVQLQQLSCIGFVLVAILGGGAVYMVSQRALRPLTAMSREAQHLSATQLHERLTCPQTRDELNEVATSFNEVLDRLERAFIQQGRFLDEVAHELRTPLAVMDAQLQQAVTQEDRGYPPSVTTLHTCRLSLNRLEHMIESLLVLARTTTTLPSAPVAVVPLAEDAITALDSVATAYRVGLEFEAAADPWVMGDAPLLFVVVLNLVKNGILYNRPYGTVTLTVAEVHNEVVITVSDTGVGIPATALSHIFERFYRVEHVRETDGAGLGLAIVADVVALHGGTVRATSIVEQGTTFVVRLPWTPSQHVEPHL